MKRILTILILLIGVNAIGQITSAKYQNTFTKTPSIDASVYKLNGVTKQFSQWVLANDKLTYQIYNDFEGDSAFTINDNPSGINVIKINSLARTLIFDDGEAGDYKIGINTKTPSYILDVNGDIHASGDITYDFKHAASFLEDITYDLTLTTKDRYYKITPTFPITGNNIEIEGITFAGDTLTIITAGDYFITFGFSMTSGTNNEEYKWAIFKNGVKQYGQKRTWITGNVAGGNVIMYLTGLVAGDDISFRMTNLSNNTDVARLSNLNFYIEKKPE